MRVNVPSIASYGQRVIWANNHMTDIRPGSKWILHVVKYVEGLMRERKVDGVFLDALGARPWGTNVRWESWSQSEKNMWSDGAIDLVRRLDVRRPPHAAAGRVPAVDRSEVVSP